MPKRGENIYKRRDGRWEGRFAVKSACDNTSKYKSVYGRTYKEVRQKLTEEKNRYNISSGKKLSFDTVCILWLKHVEIRVKASSLANYKYLLNKHIMPSFSNINMAELSPSMLNQFIRKKLECGRLDKRGGLSKKYLKDIVSVIKSIAAFCEREFQITNRIKYITAPKPAKKEIHILNKDEQQTLTKYLLQNINTCNVGILVCMYTGLRLGEICGLKWSDIDFQEKTLTVRRNIQRISDSQYGTHLIIGTPKTEKSLRTIPVPEFLFRILKKCRDKNDNYILSQSTDFTQPQKLRRSFKATLKKCNISNIRFHDLRHTFASNCIRLKFDVKSLSEILGHSSVSMTLNLYVHSSMEVKRYYMNQLEI